MKRRKKGRTIPATPLSKRPTVPAPSLAVLFQEYENALGKMNSRIPEQVVAEEADPDCIPTVIPPAPIASEVRLVGAVSEPVAVDLERDSRTEKKVG